MKFKYSHITVLLPFHNAGQTLDRAIQSIVNQTCTDWKLVLINNNADTTSSQIAHHWQQADSRISVLFEPVQGIAPALNSGLKATDTEFIARMDADDISMPDRLDLQRHYLLNHPEVGVVGCRSIFESDISDSEGFERFVTWQNSIITPEEHVTARFIESPVAHPGVMFRKKLIEQFGDYSTEPLPEDYELWLRWMNAGVQFAKLPLELLIWRDHSDRLSRTHSNYSKEAFYVTKCRYLAQWLNHPAHAIRKVVICGTSKINRMRAQLLIDQGVRIFGFTDVVNRRNKAIHFIPLDEIVDPGAWLLVSFISKRGIGNDIRNHFCRLGFSEGTDFVLAA